MIRDSFPEIGYKQHEDPDREQHPIRLELNADLIDGKERQGDKCRCAGGRGEQVPRGLQQDPVESAGRQHGDKQIEGSRGPFRDPGDASVQLEHCLQKKWMIRVVARLAGSLAPGPIGVHGHPKLGPQIAVSYAASDLETEIGIVVAVVKTGVEKGSAEPAPDGSDLQRDHRRERDTRPDTPLPASARLLRAVFITATPTSLLAAHWYLRPPSPPIHSPVLKARARRGSR